MIPRRFPLSDVRVPYSKVSSLAVAMYLALAVTNSLVTSSVPRRVMVVVGLGLLACECLAFPRGRGERWLLLGVGLWIATGLWLHGVIFGEVPLEGIYLPCNIGVALAIARGHVSTRTVTPIFAGVTLLLGSRLLTAKGVESALYSVLATSSANGVSEIMIALATTYYLCSRAEHRPVHLAPAIACAVLSALALGRSGIASSLMLLLGVAIAALIEPQPARSRWQLGTLYLSLAIAAGFLVREHFDQVRFVVNRFAYFGLVSEGRDAIRIEYLSRVQAGQALLGFDRTAEFAGYLNLHNSYLFWHRQLGIFAVPLYVLTLLAACLAPRRGLVVVASLTAILFRSFFDESLLPFRLHDYAYFALIATVFFDPSRASAASRRGQLRPEQPIGLSAAGSQAMGKSS